MIYLFNNNEEMIRIIPNSAIKRMYQTQTLTDENYISDRLDVEIQALNDEELSRLEYMAIDDIENPQRFHYYFIAKETTEHQITSLTGVQSGIEELRKTPVYDMRPTDRSPKFIADRLLEGTNWQAGYTTDDVGTISTNFYYTDVFSALKKMCMAFGIEMQLFVEITTNRIGARYIEFRKRTGKSVGKRVVYGHNALKIVKEVEKTNTVTALIGRGKGVQVSVSDEGNIGYGRKIGFENVEWKTSSGAPVDKPLGQEFVEIPELTLQYGIKNSNGTVRPKIGFVEFQDEESETRLIERTYNALLELSRPQVLLETSSVYLPDTGIGDTVNVVRHDRDLRYQTRVFEITWDRLANKAVDMKLGDRLGESENKRISRISSQVSGNISTELSSTVDELADRLTSADGKNTNWYTDYDPMENPETMGLVRVNDNWYQPDPEYEGEFILKQWNGEMWVEILRTSGNPELVRRIEEAMTEAEQAKEAAEQAYTDAVAEAKAHADAEVQASKEHFDSLIEEVESDVAGAQATAASAVEEINTAIENAGFTSLDETINNISGIASGAQTQINTAIQNAGFTSLDETIQNMNYITMNANQNAQQAITNASNAYGLAQTSISEAQTAQANSLTALGKADDALVGVSDLDIRVDEFEGELELKADNTFMNEDGTLTTLSNAITFNANRFSSDMQRIESRVESLAGEINLVVLRGSIEDAFFYGGEVFPNPTLGPSFNSNAMGELIEVNGGESFALSKEMTGFDDRWRINFYDENHNFISRFHPPANTQDIMDAPPNAKYMWVSYPKDSKPQIIRGTDFISYRPNLADQLTSDEMVIFRNEYDEFADKTVRRLTAIDGSDGRLEVAEALITQTANGLQTTVGKVDDQGSRLSTVEQTASGLQSTVNDPDNGLVTQVTQLTNGYNILVSESLKSLVPKNLFDESSEWELGSQVSYRGVSDENLSEIYVTGSDSSTLYGGNRIQVHSVLVPGRRYKITLDVWSVSNRYISIGQAESRNNVRLIVGNHTQTYEVVYEAPSANSFSIYFHHEGTYRIGNITVVESTAISQSQLSVLEGSITSTVSGLDERLSTVEQLAGGLQTTVADKANQSQVTQLADGYNILVSESLKSLVSKNLFDDTSDWELGGNVNYYGRSADNLSTIYVTGSDSSTLYGGNRIQVHSVLIPGRRYKITLDIWSPSNRYISIGQAESRNNVQLIVDNTTKTYEVVYEASSTYGFSIYFHHEGTYRIGNIRVLESTAISQSQISVLQNNINLRVSKNDIVNQINVSPEGILIDGKKIHITGTTTIDNGVIKNAHIGELDAGKIKTGTISAARLNASDIVTNGLSANVIESEHIKSSVALVNKIFSQTAYIKELTTKTAFIEEIKAVEIDAGKITTGELNAANVSIVNLDVNKLTGNVMNFISGAFTSNAGSLLLSGNGIRVNFSNGYNLRINGAGTNYYTSGGQPIGGLLTTTQSAGATHSLSLNARRGYAVSIGYQGSLSYNQSNRALEVDGTTGNITIERPIYESSGSAGLSFTRSQMGNVGWGLLLASTKATGSGIFLADNGEVWIGISGGYKQFT